MNTSQKFIIKSITKHVTLLGTIEQFKYEWKWSVPATDSLYWCLQMNTTFLLIGRNSRSGGYTCNTLDAGGIYIVHNHVHVQYIHDCMSLLKEE